MALSASLVWEVRTTGSATNSGGFRAGAGGTDYSQQDAPQATFADLAIDAADATKVTSATVAFAADHDGNTLRVTGGTGFTAGVYEVMSVAAGVATLDRDCGTVGSTGGTGVLGGALDNPKPLESLAVSGNTIQIKAGTYVMSSGGLDLKMGSLSILGYDQTRGDLDADPTNANRPVIQINSAQWFQVDVGNNVVANLKVKLVDGGTKLGGFLAPGRNNLIKNCEVVGPFANGYGIKLSQGLGAVESCEVSGDATTSIEASSSATIHGCYIHGNTTGTGITAGYGSSITRNIIANISGDGVRTSAGSTVSIGQITANTIHGCGGHGISLGGATGGAVVQGNLITGCAGAGISNDTQVGFRPSWDGNAFWDNDGGNHANLDGPSAFSPALDVALSADPYVDADGGDYRLNDTAGGGAACRGSAPGNAWPGSTSTGSLDMGAIQSAGSGGGESGDGPVQLLILQAGA